MVASAWGSQNRRADDRRSQFEEDPMNIDLIGSTAHEGLMYLTPVEYQDDVNAFLYYGTFGLMDPKNPTIDAPATRKATGWSYSKALGFTLIGGFLFWGTLGWFIDPKDKRDEVGGWRSEWYDKWMNPDNYSLPEGY